MYKRKSNSEKPAYRKSGFGKSRQRKPKSLPPPPGMVRLQKILAEAGVDSRRNCELLIQDGAVTVNGKILDTLPAFANPETDDIRVHGRRLQKQSKVYFLFNKPKNVICTNYDPQRRRKAVDYIDCAERIFCVGRLDNDTTGALLLTNDSELANRLTHPKYELPKTYQVSLKGRMDVEAIDRLKQGVWLSDGRSSKAAVKVLHRSNLETVIEITLGESLNREIHRVMARVGFKVKALKRTHIGTLQIKGLPPGGYRPLTSSEVRYLYKSTRLAEDDGQEPSTDK